MSRRYMLPPHPAAWLIALTILFPSLAVSQTWRDTLQYAIVTGVGVSTRGTVGDSLNNAMVEEQIRFHMKEEKLRQGDAPSRVVGRTITVTTIEDTGEGSLRKAITDANTSPGKDVIAFNILPAGPKQIRPRSKLPNIVDSVVIDGTTQDGFVDRPMIEINFEAAGPYDGLDMYAGNSTIRGLVLNRVVSGSVIVLWSGGGNVFEGNYFGTNLFGTARLGNAYNGIWAKTPRNRIGGTTPAQRNVFSGNGYPSVAFTTGSDENLVQGNYFGTDYTGMILLGNPEEGVLCDFGSIKDTIGGLDPAARNIISGSVQPYSGMSIVGHVPNSTGHVVVIGNYFGTDVTGTRDFGNGGNGIYIWNSHDNQIGGTDPRARNIISGNALPGVSIRDAYAINNVVQGNYIGTDSTGTFPVGNSQVGVLIDKAPNNLIGGLATGAGNVISGNFLGGVVIRETTSFGNQVQGNLIGTMPNGLNALPNGVRGVWLIRAKQNTIGGPTPQAGNVIAGNAGDGIQIEGVGAWGNIIQNNAIGTDTSATYPLGNYGRGIYAAEGTNNTIRFNRIYFNGGLGIDLKPDGVTPNDTTDADEGANTLLNFPILDSATIGSGTIRIRGRIRGKPNFVYDVDFFRNDVKHSSHFGEGQTLIGSATLLSDGDGKVDLNVILSAVVAPNQFITATATDADGNTSEFSRAICLSDLDGDGIFDCWETKDDGIDWNADGKIDLNLWDKGARPDHKDLFVEVDVMSGTAIESGALAMVKSAFAGVKNKYVGNPDGQDGIDLHLEYAPFDGEIPHAAWAEDPWPEFFAAKKLFFGTADEYADPNSTNILDAKRLVYRYCIFADRFGTKGRSGIAETHPGVGGNDFMVTLGSFPFVAINAPFQAGTFMHELGHTLGLLHGGGDTIGWKPNYYSVMNYVWQAPRFASQYGARGWTLNYSPVALPPLVEDHLYELLGLDPKPGDFPEVTIPFNGVGNTDRVAMLRPGTAIDWDGDGDSSGYAEVAMDPNFLFRTPPEGPTPGEVLWGYADWPNLVFNFRNSPRFRDPSPAAMHLTMAVDPGDPEEMTPGMYEYLQSLPPYGIETPLSLWPVNPGENIPVATAPSRQGSPVIASDGRGGAIIAYFWEAVIGDPSGSGMDVYAQCIDSLGGIQWRSNGVPVCTAGGAQQPTAIVPDGQGGAIIVWQDTRDGLYEVYAQRINAQGEPLWAANGVPVTTAANESRPPFPVAVFDQRLGAIVAWRDGHSGTYSVYAQRIDQDGIAQWPAGGLLISTTPATLRDTIVQMTGDDSAGAIITWVDRRAGAGVQNHDIYAQRVDGDGVVRWAPGGIPLCVEPQQQDWPRIRRDGTGGAVVAWHDLRISSDDVYVQRVNANGEIQWEENGVLVGEGGSLCPEIVGDGSGGAIIVWMDYRAFGPMYDVYAQRVNGEGAVMWQEDGVPICNNNMSGLHPAIVTDMSGGAVIAWSNRRGPGMDIYAQRIDSAGVAKWTTNGVPVSTALSDQLYPVGVTNRAGGGIFSWYDQRNGGGSESPDIYAQNVTAGGVLGHDVVTDVDDQHPDALPKGFLLRQNYPNPFNPFTTIRYDLPGAAHVTLKVYDVLGQVVAVLVDERQGAGEKSVTWNASRFASGVYLYRLSTGGFVQARKMMVVK